MPPGVSGVLLKIMLSCDTCCIYLSLCVLTACVLANKGVHLSENVCPNFTRLFVCPQLSALAVHCVLLVLWMTSWLPIGNDSAPIPLAQCWFPGLAISNAETTHV